LPYCLTLVRTGKLHPVRRDEEGGMCLTCGCGEPNDDHGDSRHIVMDELKAAAEAAEVSVDEAAGNLQATYPKGK
ncbi:MAG: hypothetical protein ACRDHB_02505, partial [Actinomycetota bacterium]